MQAEFIPGSKGDLFALYLPPDPSVPDRGDLIFVPPFAEEMNRARSTVAAHARMLQRLGTGVLLLDLYGTGDSEGAFADARWETWRGDVLAARQWLGQRGRERIGLWGLRLGGLLAADVLFEAAASFSRAVLWEPVVSGKAYMDRFLRIGIAEGMEAGGRSLTLNEMRLKLSRTEPIEVAGYVVSRSLAHGIDRSNLVDLAPALALPVTWIDFSPPSGERREACARCAAAGVALELREFRAAPFWALQETAPDAALAAATAAAMVA